MESQNSPLVSIVIPSYNQGRYIGETISSCLSQDYRPIEILVFDGGSTDGTIDVLRSFSAPEIVWKSERDGGVVDAVNKGLKAARGEFITIQSSDDLFENGALRAAVTALEQDPSAGLVFGDVILIDQKGQEIGRDLQVDFSLADYLGRLSYIPQPGSVFRASAGEAAGSWRDDVSFVADADFWIRIALKYPVVKLNRVVAKYRYHDEQRDKNRGQIASDWENMAQKLIGGGHLVPELVRSAKMGIHLARYRYSDEAAWWMRTKELYAAILSNPGAFRDQRFPKRELIPFRAPIWREMSKLKRRLGLQARTR